MIANTTIVATIVHKVHYLSKIAVYTKKTGILRTFEIFNRENFARIRDKIAKVILVETENIFAKNKKMFNIDLKKDNSPQITVFNDVETYNLLSNALKRQQMKSDIVKRIKSDDKNNESSIPDKLSVS